MNNITGDVTYSRDNEIIRLLTKWANYQDHDLCFDADEILVPLCELFEIPINRKLNLTKEQFCAGCASYQDKLFPELGHKKPYFPQVFFDE